MKPFPMPSCALLFSRLLPCVSLACDSKFICLVRQNTLIGYLITPEYADILRVWLNRRCTSKGESVPCHRN
ncbi:hypothetical protein JOM56_007195 [Amanita muscaria]